MIFNKEQDKAPYKEKIKSLVPFDEISPQAQNEIVQIGKIFKFKNKDIVFKQGDHDNYAFYLLEGKIDLMAGRDVKSTIVGGTDSARYAMARLLPRQFTARAKVDSMVLQLDKAAVDRILVADKSEEGDITTSRHFVVNEIDQDDTVDWMTKMLQSEIFSQLPTANIQQLFVMLEPIDYKAGDTVIKQGEPGDSYYIVQEGHCEVSRAPSEGAKPIKLAELKDGDSFGEEALLTDGIRNASVTMLTDGTLMKLSKENFITLVTLPSLNEISFEQGKSLVDGGAAVWLDVRFKDEYEESNIKSSINIPFNLLRAKLDSLDRGKHYLVCCDSGGRSSAAVFTMISNGFKASVLKGGLSTSHVESSGVNLRPKQKAEPEKKPEAKPVARKDDSEGVNLRPRVKAEAGQKAKPETKEPGPEAESKPETKPKAEAKPEPVQDQELETEDDDPSIRSAALDADMTLNDIRLERTSNKLSEAKDDEDTTEIREKKKQLEEERKQLAEAKKAAEEETRKFREEEARKIEKLKEETEKRLAEEKKKLEEIYTKNTREMEKLLKLKEQAEEQLRKEREKIEKEAEEARKKLESADEVKRKLEESRKALEEESARKREEQSKMEQEIQTKAMATLEAERRKLAEEFMKANNEIDQANKENTAAEAARKAAAEEAKKIIEEYKKQFEKERAKERARLEQERKQLELESGKIKQTLSEIDKTRKEAEAAKAAAALEAQKLRAAQADSLDDKAREEAAEALRMAEHKLLQAEKSLESVHQVKVNLETTAEIKRREMEMQSAKHDILDQQVAADLASFKEEQLLEEAKQTRVMSHSEHVRRIKEKAEAAKRAAKNATNNLFEDIQSQLGKKD